MIACIAAGVLPPGANFLLTNDTGADATAAHVHCIGPAIGRVVNQIALAEAERLAKLPPVMRPMQVVSTWRTRARPTLLMLTHRMCKPSCSTAVDPVLPAKPGGTGRMDH